MPEDAKRDLLRHGLATIAYRAGKIFRNAPSDFGSFDAGGGVRSPRELVAHMSDVLEWALSIAMGEEKWANSEAHEWDSDVGRFLESLKALDAFLASETALHVSEEKLLQGPIADVLTHVGQLALLRRLAFSPVRSENYLIASVELGRVGADQTAPPFEFG